jgi:hypothetical protein
VRELGMDVDSADALTSAYDHALSRLRHDASPGRTA